MLTRRRLLTIADAGLILPASPAIVRANLLQKPITGGGGGGTYALVAHTIAQSATGTTTTAGTPINTSGATLLVIVVSGFNNSLPWTVTDSKGNTYTLAVADPAPYTSNPNTVTLWHNRGGTVGSGHTAQVVAGGGGGAATLSFAAFSGGNVSPLDQTNHANATGTSLAAGSITPLQPNELIVAGLSLKADAITTSGIGINGGFTIADSAPSVNATQDGGGLAYLIQTSIVAANPTWSWTNSTVSLAVIASFK
jgi:hypothetical protein